MSRRGEIEPSSAVKTPEPFAEERASRRRKIINKIMNVIVVVGIAIDLFFAILYSVLDTRAYVIAIGVNLATAALWAMTPSESVWSGHLPSWADFITTTPVFRFSVHTRKRSNIAVAPFLL